MQNKNNQVSFNGFIFWEEFFILHFIIIYEEY
jgi:hypothetical protein